MSLITAAYVKENFEPWSSFCTVPTSSFTADEILDKKIALAEIEFSQYSDATADDITDELKRHLLNIVRKNCFDIRHGDTRFEHKPQILIDYESSIETLKIYGRRVAEVDSSASIRITSKPRKFGTWFNETDDVESVSTPE